MRSPFDFKNEMMRRDSSFFAFVANALIDQSLHPFDELGGCESASRLDSATQSSIDDAAHTFEHASQDAFGQCFLAFFL